MSRDIHDYLGHKSEEELTAILRKAYLVAKVIGDKCTANDLQDNLGIGYEAALAIHDLFSDRSIIDPAISNHWVRCGRAYALNNISPSLAGMADALAMGGRRAFLVMLELERRKVIYSRSDFSFAHHKRMASFDDLLRQMKVLAKKYNGRCDPELLVRRMFVDETTAFRLAQYGEEHLDLRWKRQSQKAIDRSQ